MSQTRICCPACGHPQCWCQCKENHSNKDSIAATDAGCCGHASDCAVHNEPAMPAADCDCGFKG